MKYMAAKTLSQINSQLNKVYNPQIKSVRNQQALVDQGVEADIAEAQGLQTQAFDQILGGARQRGMGFSGIPLGEQAKYSSTVFAPTVLRAKVAGQQQRTSLEDAILGIRERQFNNAQQLRQQSVQNSQWERQFQEDKRRFGIQIAEARRQAAQARAAAASAMPTYGSFGGSTPSKSKGKADYEAMAAQNIQQFLGMDANAIRSDYAATLASANRGNPMDKIKIKLYQHYRPDLFKKNQVIQRGVNSGGLTSYGYSPNNSGLVWGSGGVRNFSF